VRGPCQTQSPDPSPGSRSLRTRSQACADSVNLSAMRTTLSRKGRGKVSSPLTPRNRFNCQTAKFRSSKHHRPYSLRRFFLIPPPLAGEAGREHLRAAGEGVCILTPPASLRWPPFPFRGEIKKKPTLRRSYSWRRRVRRSPLLSPRIKLRGWSTERRYHSFCAASSFGERGRLSALHRGFSVPGSAFPGFLPVSCRAAGHTASSAGHPLVRSKLT
jgi:hypothetical protein